MGMNMSLNSMKEIMAKSYLEITAPINVLKLDRKSHILLRMSH